MSKTAAGLVAFAKTKLGTNYVYGMKGAILTEDKYNMLKRMYPNDVPDTDKNKIGTICCDCSGLIAWYTGNIRSSSGFKTSATKILPISEVDKAVPGCAVWKQGHIGVYIGNGEIIEEMSPERGCVQTKVANRNFTHFLWIKDIDYSTPATTDTTSATIGAAARVVEAIKAKMSYKTTGNLNLRDAAISGKVIAVMPKGSAVTLLKDQGNGWSQVDFNGKIGYCSNKYLTGNTSTSLSSTSMTATPTATVKDDTTVTTQITAALVLRSAPTSKGSKIDTMKFNDTVTIIEDTGWGWSKVKYNGKTGYCANAYLKLSTLSKKKTLKNNAATNVNIRSSYDATSNNIIGKIPSKAGFVVNGFTADTGGNRWLDVTFSKVTGWVYYDPSYIG